MNLKIFSIFFISNFILLSLFYGIARKEHINAIKERLKANAAAASLAINGEDLKHILSPQDKDTPYYKTVKSTLEKLAVLNPDIRFIYTMRKDTEGNIRFVVDGEDTFDANGDGIISEDEEAAEINELYPEPPKQLIRGFSVPSVDDSITQDKWGRYISGYAPIRDKRNKVVGIIGIDMLAETIDNKLAYLNFLYAAGTLVLFISSFIVMRFIRNTNTRIT